MIKLEDKSFDSDVCNIYQIIRRLQRDEGIMKKKDSGQYDDGFTLIELLVVILIIAILAAVGIVALLGAIRSGQDSAAKQALTNAYKESQTLAIDGDDIAAADFSEVPAGIANVLNTKSPDFTWQTTEILGDPTNVIAIGFSDSFVLGSRSKSGNCFYLSALGGLADGVSPTKYASLETQESCEVAPSQANLTDTDKFKTYK